MDRGVYQSLKLPVALHPSESPEFMLTRVLAWALEFEEGIAFSPGVGSPEEPTLSIKALDGTYNSWIEIGAPDSERLHKATKIAKRVAVYCHRSADNVFQQLLQKQIYRGAEVPLYSFEDGFISLLVRALERRNKMSVSRSDQTIYIALNGHDLSSHIMERRLA